MAHLDHIVMVNRKQSTTLGKPVVVGACAVDGEKEKSSATGRFTVVAHKVGGGTGYVRLWNYKAAQEVAILSFTETEKTGKVVATNGSPCGEVCYLELQLYTDGTGEIVCEAASLEVN